MHQFGFIYAIGAAITWGLVYTIDQKILMHTSPVLLIFLNALISLIVILPFIILTEDLKVVYHIDRNTLLLILFSQLLAILASFFIFSGIKILGASLTSIFEIMYPMFVILFSYLIFGELLSGYFWIGSGFLFLGSIILVTKPSL
jgi:drug/metabolite transporter (DMT)-like permease